MLMPKKVKHRKQMRGRMKGLANRGSIISFGEYGLKTLEAAWITDRQIEAAWRAASRDQPPVALDDSIRAAARRAVAAAPGKKPKSWWRVKTHWLPLAAAAA